MVRNLEIPDLEMGVRKGIIADEISTTSGK